MLRARPAVAARAGVHRRHKHESSGIGGGCRGTADGDHTILQRLPQRLQHIALKFRQFVQKQHAKMREACFTRHCVRAASNERRRGCTMVRRTERAFHHNALSRGCAHDGMNFRNLQRFFQRQLRENGGNAAREHGLARPGRTDHEQIMPACNGDFRSPLGPLLPLDIGKINAKVDSLRIPGLYGSRLDSLRAAQMRHQFTQRMHGEHGQIGQIGGFERVFGRQRHHTAAACIGAKRHGQYAGHRPHGSIQRQLAKDHQSIRCAQRYLAGGGQQRNGNRQIVYGALFAHTGRREADGNMRRRKDEPGVLNRGPHAIARLPHGGVRQPYRLIGRQSAREIGFNRDQKAANAV